ncbi:MAG: sigma-70 family RNA polymerase sigma factor [Gemmatimonadota bacterium]
MSRERREEGEVTRLLRRAREGEPEALELVFPLVLEELRAVAAGRLRGEAVGHTLQPTALVNEAYLKLVASPEVDWRDRAHFLAVAARAMRQVLVDRARRRNADKRGAGARPTTLSGKGLLEAGGGPSPEETLALDAALEKLDRVDSRLREVVELRFFAGLTDTEIAEALGVTRRTIQRDWTKARAWLYAELDRGGGDA